MNDINIFLLFNPELKRLNINELKSLYLTNLKTNELVFSINSFFEKYPNFSLDNYKEKNSHIKNLSTINILAHYHINNINFCEKYNNNDKYIDNYIDKYDDNNIINNLNEKIKEIDEIIYDEIDSLKIKLCHIFVHFFEIGGGETYLSNFSINSDFEQILFINKNYPNITLSKYNCDVLYYNNYEELNEMLINLNFDIIIDHQLYWFDNKITKITFKNIEKNKIIRITHGVPIHFKNINDLEYYYSIELYNEKKSNMSWNNHIKFYTNIGVEIPLINKINNIDFNKFDNTKIYKIIIVGRINEEKVPKDFLKCMLDFLKINDKYNFYFYGIVDENYSNYFFNMIKQNKLIQYGGVINPKDIGNLYINNDILIHPSKFEAGATVILEAMSYGLPVIARNTSGVIYALDDKNFLCNNEKEMFDKLLLINEENYKNISIKNINKIKKNNNKELNLNKLYNEIKLINFINNYLENNNNLIPNIIHYIYGLKKQTEEFPFIYYISILSNKIINKPYIIFFHYQYEPYGKWWDEAKKLVSLNYIDTTNIYWGKKKIIKYAHKADKIRLEMLYKYGGIYMDIDTITIKSYKNLMNNNFIIGIQEENYGEDGITLYCNAILFSRPKSIFLKKWIESYENYFEPNGWSEASIFLPEKILKTLDENEKKEIKILDKDIFYKYLYNETNLIFENDNIEINSNLLTLHLWNSFSQKYFEEYNNFNKSLSKNSLYSKLLNNLIIYTEKK
jgi:glycosyltransferase involved in cell wall biosynthesis